MQSPPKCWKTFLWMRVTLRSIQGWEQVWEAKQDLVQFLKKSIDVFAWSHEDIPSINPSVITHRLNVYPSFKPVRQKKIVFTPERDNAIKEEVQKLTTALYEKFITRIGWLMW